VARILDDADVGARPPAGELDVFQVVDPVPGALSGRRPAGAVEHDEVALQPQAIIPFAFLTQADQIGRAVEAVPISRTLARVGSQRATASSSAFWVSNPIAPSVSSTRQASGKARSPQRSASIST
jgi:hypothetical protein